MSALLAKLVPLLKAIVWELCQRFFTDYAFRIRLPDCSKLGINQKNDNDVTICQHDLIVNLFWRCFVSLVKVSYWSGFMSISSLLLKLWQFTFIKDWPEIQKSEIPLSDFFPISGDWGKLGKPELTRIFLMKRY